MEGPLARACVLQVENALALHGQAWEAIEAIEAVLEAFVDVVQKVARPVWEM